MVGNEYLGYDVLTADDDEVNGLVSGNYGARKYDFFNNEYVIVKDRSGCCLGTFKCVGGTLKILQYRDINSKYCGLVKPRNPQQVMAVDLLYDPDTTVKMIAGKFGTGKDFLMSAAAIDLVERGKFDKIVYVRNNIEVKDSKPIGFLPGSYDEKMLPFAMPLADHLGGTDGLELMARQGRLEVVHLGFIRGRDIKNAIIYCSEAENMTKEHIQLLLGRVGEGSSLWINGDFKQCDSAVFEKNSGMMIAVDRLRGHKRFGYVKLLKTERSETAAMADLLD